MLDWSTSNSPSGARRHKSGSVIIASPEVWSTNNQVRFWFDGSNNALRIQPPMNPPSSILEVVLKLTRRSIACTGRLLLLLGCGAFAHGAEWHVSTNGAAANPGTEAAPWDISSALGGKQKVAAGDTVWIHCGTYKSATRQGSMGYLVKLAGGEGRPVHVRAWKGDRVTIDGGLDVQAPASHLWLWDLEILVSEPRPAGPIPPDPTYRNVNRPWGGLNVYGGDHCKFINLVVHDNCQGASWWAGSKESEMHGCIFYDNGWAGTDRGHGHAIYTQNKEGVKTISDCLFTGGYGYTLHAYGSSRADVDHYLVEGNVAWNAHTFLLGGGKPSHGIRLLTNFFYGVPVQLGYSAPTNDDCEVRGNSIANAGLTINRFGRVLKADNTVFGKNDPRPKTNQAILRPNKYEPRRANLVIFNWEGKATVTVDATGFLKAGESFRLLDPRGFFGKPVMVGKAAAPSITVPMSGEFGAFVLMRE
jgi:hypothetical protein